MIYKKKTILILFAELGKVKENAGMKKEVYPKDQSDQACDTARVQ